MLLIAIIKYSSLNQKEEIDQLSTENFNVPSLHEAKNNYKDKNKINSKSSILFYIGFLGIIAIITAFSSLFLVFPAAVLDEYSLHRPYEIPPLILFCIVLFYFFKNQMYKKKDIIYKGLVLYLVIDIFTQLTMSFSAVSFDTTHNMAHVLKDIGYFVNVIALVLSSMQYITNLRKINEQIQNNMIRMQQAEKMKDEFVNIAAHELRTPIQPILVLSELLQASIKNHTVSHIDPNELETEVEIIHRNAQKLQKLTNDILDVSKIDNKDLKLCISKFDLREVISNAIKDFDMEMERKKKNIIIVSKSIVDEENKAIDDPLSSTPIWIYGDKSRIGQVLSNLIHNAIKFTSKGTISIITELKTKTNQIVVSVCDTGQGIRPEIMPRLFEKFSSDSTSGTGLGLFICKNLIEAHGGKIWAKNNVNEAGATFSFILPYNL